MRKSRIAAVLVVLIISALSIKMILARGLSNLEGTEVSGLYLRHHSVDAGEITGTDPFRARVELINRGPTVMRVETAQPDCGCTSVAATAVEIPPDARAVSIPVIVDVNALPSGKFIKSVLFSVSDGGNRHGRFLFHVEGVIDRSAVLRSLESVIDFGSVAPSQNPENTLFLSGPAGLLRGAQRDVDLDSPVDKTIDLPRVSSSDAQLIQPVHIRLHVGPSWRSERFHFTLSFHTAGAGDLHIALIGAVQQGIISKPSRLLIFPDDARSSVSILLLPPRARMKDILIRTRGPIVYELQELAPAADGRCRVQLSVRHATSATDRSTTDSAVFVTCTNQKSSLEIPAIVLPPQRPLAALESGTPSF